MNTVLKELAAVLLMLGMAAAMECGERVRGEVPDRVYAEDWTGRKEYGLP